MTIVRVLVSAKKYNIVNIRYDTTWGILLPEDDVTFVHGLTNSIKPTNWRYMTARSNIFFHLYDPGK